MKRPRLTYHVTVSNERAVDVRLASFAGELAAGLAATTWLRVLRHLRESGVQHDQRVRRWQGDSVTHERWVRRDVGVASATASKLGKLAAHGRGKVHQPELLRVPDLGDGPAASEDQGPALGAERFASLDLD